MLNSRQHRPKPPFVTCFNFNPFFRLFKVWPACPGLGWHQRGHIAVNSALPLHLSRWYPAKAAGLFRRAPAPAESLILRFKPRVNFLFSTDSETNYLYSPPVIPFPCIGKALQHRPLYLLCHSVCILCCFHGSASANVAELGVKEGLMYLFEWLKCSK